MKILSLKRVLCLISLVFAMASAMVAYALPVVACVPVGYTVCSSGSMGSNEICNPSSSQASGNGTFGAWTLPGITCQSTCSDRANDVCTMTCTPGWGTITTQCLGPYTPPPQSHRADSTVGGITSSTAVTAFQNNAKVPAAAYPIQPYQASSSTVLSAFGYVYGSGVTTAPTSGDKHGTITFVASAGTPSCSASNMSPRAVVSLQHFGSWSNTTGITMAQAQQVVCTTGNTTTGRCTAYSTTATNVPTVLTGGGYAIYYQYGVTYSYSGTVNPDLSVAWAIYCVPTFFENVCTDTGGSTTSCLANATG